MKKEQENENCPTLRLLGVEAQGDRAADDLNGTQIMSIKKIRMEDGAQDMMESPDLQPYLRRIKSAFTGCGKDDATKALSELPLERRYLYRIASGLRSAFCDFDKSSVRADLSTLNAENFDFVVGLIDRRPVQFCMLLRVIVGAAEMEAVMLEAIDVAKRY